MKTKFTRKRIKGVIFLCLTAITAAIITFYSFGSRLPHIANSTNQTNAFSNFPVNKDKFIDFKIDENDFKSLNTEERIEQIRDWLLLTVASNGGLSADNFNQSTYDLSTIRYGYMKPISNFEYGSARSLYLGNGKVIVLIPEAMQEDTKLNVLENIADRQRKNLGKLPDSLLIFEYEINLNKRVAYITRREALETKSFFDQDKGYYEAEVGNIEDLQQFVDQIDDITFAQVKNFKLLLGGRKIKNYKVDGKIDIHNIAEIWKTAKRVQEDLAKARDNWKTKLGLPFESQEALQSKKVQEEQQEKKHFKVASSSGFSLDPVYKYHALQDVLKATKALFVSLTLDKTPSITREDIEQAETGLDNDDPFPYFYIVNKLFESLDHRVQNIYELGLYRNYTEKHKLQDLLTKFKPFLLSITSGGSPVISEQDVKQVEIDLSNDDRSSYESLIDKLNQLQASFDARSEKIFKVIANTNKNCFQIARYDGGLQDTEVGMVLFYTDLLAKLWSMNYENATTKSSIPGFKPATRLALSPIYQQEFEELSSTRVWFEPSRQGFQIVKEGSAIAFDRNSTRISAVSHSDKKSNIEKPANAISDAFISWWNSHYEDISFYEPQYNKLNQIMKWSILIAWLNHNNKGDLLSLVQEVPAKNLSYWFPTWAQDQGDHLRIHDWKSIRFFDKWENDTANETLPLLFSEPSKPFGKTKQFSGGVALASQNLIEEHSTLPNDGKVDERSFRSNIKYDSIDPRSKHLKFRTLEDTVFELADEGLASASVTIYPAKRLNLRGRESELVNSPLTRKTVLADSGLEVKTSVDGTALGDLSISKAKNGFSVGWHSRDLIEGQSLAIQLSQIPKGEIEKTLSSNSMVKSIVKLKDESVYFVEMYGASQWVKISPEATASTSIPSGWQSRAAHSPDKPDEVSDSSHVIYLAWVDEQTITKELSKGTAEAIRYLPSKTSFANFEAFIDYLKSNDYQQAAQIIAENPQEFKELRQKFYTNKLQAIDHFLQAKHYAAAEHEVDELILLYGQQPKLMFRKAIAGIGQQKLDVKIISSGQPDIKPSESKNIVFSEVNALLSQSAGKDEFTMITADEATFYIQDFPGLNNINWNIPVENIIPLIPISIGVYELKPGDLEDQSLGSVTPAEYLSTPQPILPHPFEYADVGQAYPSGKPSRFGPDQTSQCYNKDSQEPRCNKRKSVYILFFRSGAFK